MLLTLTLAWLISGYMTVTGHSGPLRRAMYTAFPNSRIDIVKCGHKERNAAAVISMFKFVIITCYWRKLNLLQFFWSLRLYSLGDSYIWLASRLVRYIPSESMRSFWVNIDLKAECQMQSTTEMRDEKRKTVKKFFIQASSKMYANTYELSLEYH